MIYHPLFTLCNIEVTFFTSLNLSFIVTLIAKLIRSPSWAVAGSILSWSLQPTGRSKSWFCAELDFISVTLLHGLHQNVVILQIPWVAPIPWQGWGTDDLGWSSVFECENIKYVRYRSTGVDKKKCEKHVYCFTHCFLIWYSWMSGFSWKN